MVTEQDQGLSRRRRHKPVPPSAVAGIITGFLGLVTFGLFSVVGLVLGLMALVRIHRSDGTFGGTSIAIIAICVSITCGTGGVLLLTGISGGDYAAVASLARIHGSITRWTQEHEQVYPSPGDWVAKLSSMNPQIEQDLHRDGEGQWCMNDGLEGIAISQVDQPDMTPLVFGCTVGSPAGCGPGQVESDPDGSTWFLFCDGSIRRVPAGDVQELSWSP